MNNSNYMVFNNHHIGASHVQKGIVCEDYSLSYIDSNMAIAVISDGHGDKNCFRSSVGAKIACEITINVIKNTLSNDEGIYNLKQSPDRVIIEIEKSIIYGWNSSVERHINENPITEEELSELDVNVQNVLRSGNKTHKVYGCTLIANTVIEGFWFGIHIGDGKCVVVRENGLYEQPIPWDNVGCVGNRSTSICSGNAIDSFRYHYDRNVPVALFVASDGVDESFDENGLNKCYHTLSLWISKLDPAECKNRTDELLNKISNGGSGDDVSIACIVNKSVEIKKPIATSEQVAEKMHELFVMLKESESRYKQLTERLGYLEEKTQKHQSEIKDLKMELDKKQAELDDMVAEKKSVIDNIGPVEEQLSTMTKQFLQAKDVKNNVDNYWRGLGVDLVDNSEEMNYIPVLAINNHTNSVESVSDDLNSDGENNAKEEKPNVEEPLEDSGKEEKTIEIIDKSVDGSEKTQDLKNRQTDKDGNLQNDGDVIENQVAYYPDSGIMNESNIEMEIADKSEKKKGFLNFFGKK